MKITTKKMIKSRIAELNLVFLRISGMGMSKLLSQPQKPVHWKSLGMDLSSILEARARGVSPARLRLR